MHPIGFEKGSLKMGEQKLISIRGVLYPEGVHPVDETGKVLLADPEPEEFAGDTAPEPGEDTHADLDDGGTKTALKKKITTTHTSDHGEATAVPQSAPDCLGCGGKVHPKQEWIKDTLIGRIWHTKCAEMMSHALKKKTK